MSLLALCLLFPVLSFALPSSHIHSLHHRAPTRPRVMTYYADWAPPQSFNCSLYDIIIYAFALPDQDFQLAWDSEQAPTQLADLVPIAHAASSLVVLSIGGWTGSRYFSDAVANPRNRDIFTNNIVAIYKQYNLDGIDIDWEYPGQLGQQGNTERAADATNMLQFFQDLRRKLGSRALLSAAVQDATLTGSDGQPMRNVSNYSKVLDWVTLMNYDAYQTRPPPGPNSPLSDACHNSSHPDSNAAGAYHAWTSAGFPPSKIVLGLPAYGYIVNSNARTLSSRSTFRAYSQDGSGQIPFNSLVAQGILVQYPNNSFQGSRGFVRYWDGCSSTPYLRSKDAGQIISYDDNESLGIKAAWVKTMKMGGVNLFDAHGDTSQYHLTHALRAALLPNTTQSKVPPIAAPSSSAVSLSSLPTASTPSATASLNAMSQSPVASPANTASPPPSASPLSSDVPQASPVPFSPLAGGVALFSHEH